MVRLGVFATLFVASAASAQIHTGLEDDEVLQRLIQAALAARPEVAAAQARAAAARSDVSVVGAMPDPSLTLGIQNDGFDHFSIGHMETSYYLVMLTQPLPFPGKLGRRSAVAAQSARVAEEDVRRSELSIVAEVQRLYLRVLRTRGDLDLLGKLEALWAQAEGGAQNRYEVGQGSQADLLRAIVERTRLRQQRLSLEAAERNTVTALNRLIGQALDAPIATASRLEDLRGPSMPPLADAVADAELRSPELQTARHVAVRSERVLAATRYDLWPDLALSAGVMPRGSMEPMWQVSVSVGLPIYAASKQLPAIDAEAARADGARASEAAIRQLLTQRTRERLDLLKATQAISGIYRESLLVQSEAMVTSTVAQYQVGKVPFAAVLEALNGYFADRSGYLGALSDGFELAIAQQELLLAAPATTVGISAAAMAGGDGGGAAMGARSMGPSEGTTTGPATMSGM